MILRYAKNGGYRQAVRSAGKGIGRLVIAYVGNSFGRWMAREKNGRSETRMGYFKVSQKVDIVERQW